MSEVGTVWRAALSGRRARNGGVPLAVAVRDEPTDALATTVHRHEGTSDHDETPAESFEAFYYAEHTALFGALLLMTRDRQEAEDLMQEAFLSLWERWAFVRRLESPSGYLYRTALNGFHSRRRRAAVAARNLGRRAHRSEPLDSVEVRDEVDRALAGLTRRERAALVLTDLLGFPSEDAAKALGIKASTVRVLVARARESVRKSAGGSDG